MMGQSIYKEIFIFGFRNLFKGFESNKILHRDGKIELNLSLKIYKKTFCDTLRRWKIMQKQEWNSQLPSQDLIKACDLNKDIKIIDKFTKRITELESKESTIGLELQLVNEDKINYKEERWQLYMLLKFYLRLYSRKGILKRASFEFLSSACDTAAEHEEKTPIFWYIVQNNLPSLKHLYRIDRVYRCLFEPSFLRFQMIKKLSQIFEVSIVLKKCFEEVKNDPKFCKMSVFSVDHILDEFGFILEQVKNQFFDLFRLIVI